MRAFLVALALAVLPTPALAVFSTIGSAPEPGALELVGLGGVVLVVIRLLNRRK